jgi:SRSO17 transposase
MVALRAHRATGSDRRHSTDHERVHTAKEGWLIGERPLPGAPSSAHKEGEEQKYYYSTLGADVPLERMAALAKSRWTIEQFYEDGKVERGLGDFQGRRWDGLHRHLALSMVAYSFLMLYSSVTRGEDPTSQEAFSPSVRHTSLPAIHRRVLVWLLEDLVLWFIETERIKIFRPRRN